MYANVNTFKLRTSSTDFQYVVVVKKFTRTDNELKIFSSQF